MTFTLHDLNDIIISRAKASPEASYTALLVSRGVEHCAQKLGEEAVETVISAVGADRDGLKAEAADLLYHLLVVLRAAEVPLEDVMKELERRTGRSGLEEKASR